MSHTAAVWKFPLQLDAIACAGARPVVTMPIGARVLTCPVQNGVPTLWAKVDPDAERAPRRFAVEGTGFVFDPAGKRYVATIQLHDGRLVLHVYEDLADGGR